MPRSNRRRIHRARKTIARTIAATLAPPGRVASIRLCNQPEPMLRWSTDTAIVRPWGPLDREVTLADGRVFRVGRHEGSGYLHAHLERY